MTLADRRRPGRAAASSWRPADCTVRLGAASSDDSMKTASTDDRTCRRRLVGMLAGAAGGRAAAAQGRVSRTTFSSAPRSATRPDHGRGAGGAGTGRRSSSTRSRRRIASSGQRSIRSRISTTSSTPTSTSSAAKKHGMFIVGHTLVWHNQTPRLGVRRRRTASRSTARRRSPGSRTHIDTVVGRYKGRINGWDVVNEAIDDEGKLRTGPVGTLAQARRAVARGDRRRLHRAGVPHGPRRRPRRRAVLQRLQRMVSGEDRGDLEAGHATCKAKGVRIDGLGLQGHWGIDYPKLDEIDHMLTEYGKLGVKLMITELDVVGAAARRSRQIGRRNHATRSARQRRRIPIADGLPAEKQQELAERYADDLQAVREAPRQDRPRHVLGRSRRPVVAERLAGAGERTDYPLLFDRQLQPKPAFDAVIETAKSDERSDV